MTMTKYEVSTPDGVLHIIEAVTHVRDSNGLTLLVDGGKSVAMFPVFTWMRQTATVIDTPAVTLPTSTASAEVSTPAATGE